MGLRESGPSHASATSSINVIAMIGIDVIGLDDKGAIICVISCRAADSMRGSPISTVPDRPCEGRGEFALGSRGRQARAPASDGNSIFSRARRSQGQQSRRSGWQPATFRMYSSRRSLGAGGIAGEFSSLPALLFGDPQIRTL
jgi:hypothetical protein